MALYTDSLTLNVANTAVLPVAQPALTVNQPQIQAHFVQMGVCCPQMTIFTLIGSTESVKQRILKIKLRVYQALGDGKSVGMGEAFRFG